MQEKQKQLFKEFLLAADDFLKSKDNINFEDEKNKLESEFVDSLSNVQRQKYSKLCEEIYRCEMFHDRILIELVLSFVGSILNGGH